MTAGAPAVGASFGGEPAARTEGLVTLVTEATFCLSGRTGDISPAAAQGFFFRDTRLLSLWALRVRGRALQVLSVTRDEPYHATFLSRLVPQGAETEVLPCRWPRTWSHRRCSPAGACGPWAASGRQRPCWWSG